MKIHVRYLYMDLLRIICALHVHVYGLNQYICIKCIDTILPFSRYPMKGKIKNTAMKVNW